MPKVTCTASEIESVSPAPVPSVALSCGDAIDAALAALPADHPAIDRIEFRVGHYCPPDWFCPIYLGSEDGYVVVFFGDDTARWVALHVDGSGMVSIQGDFEPYPMPTGSAPIPWIGAAPTTVPSPTAAAIPPGTPVCGPDDLTATAGWQGATGPMAGAITATDASQHDCLLDGSPQLVQLRSDTAILTPITFEAATEAGPGSQPGSGADPVLLRPGEQAGAFLLWEDWCRPTGPVTSLLVTLPGGGSPLVATPGAPDSTIGSTPRCDTPTADSTLTAFAFVPVEPPEPSFGPQPIAVSLSVPSTTTAGGDLAFTVSLTNEGSQPIPLTPCPTYREGLIIDGQALKPPGTLRYLLNCAAGSGTLAPGASTTFQMRYSVPGTVAPGTVELLWSIDPDERFDAGTGSGRATLVILP